MLKRSFVDALSEVSEGTPRPRINVSLADGNRMSLVNWVSAGDCLLEHWPNGSVRYFIPISQIVVVEIPDQ